MDSHRTFFGTEVTNIFSPIGQFSHGFCPNHIRLHQTEASDSSDCLMSLIESGGSPTESNGVRSDILILCYVMLCYVIYILTNIIFKDGRTENYTPYINTSQRRTDLPLYLIIKRGCVTVGQCGPCLAKSGGTV